MKKDSLLLWKGSRPLICLYSVDKRDFQPNRCSVTGRCNGCVWMLREDALVGPSVNVVNVYVIVGFVSRQDAQVCNSRNKDEDASNTPDSESPRTVKMQGVAVEMRVKKLVALGHSNGLYDDSDVGSRCA